eukprot:TRINITY_DN5047_c0_g1_i1.p1 TRINITY_DN5047_c0_g1~~TRINITY_DN5047_c0_g1_i1.p1  ORF type:complete len:602 (+),score=239.34 TRINITY_DN5047_c0_g1_i1:128-1933(+)
MDKGGNEVDGIILVSLRDIGCDIGDEVKSVGALDPDTFLISVIKAIAAIDENKKFALPLPRNMSQKVNLCSEIASAIKEIGFKGDLSYHHLLYPNEADSRRLLIFLVEAIPRDAQGAEATSSENLVQAAIMDKLQTVQKGPAHPPLSYSLLFHYHSASIKSVFIQTGKNRALDNYARTFLPFVSKQVPNRQDVAPSILEFNQILLNEQQEKEREWSDAGLKPWEYQKRKQGQLAKVMSEFVRVAMNSKFEPSHSEFRKPKRGGLLKGTRFMHQVDFAKANVVIKTQKTVTKESEKEQEERRDKEKADLDAQLQALIAETDQYNVEAQKYSMNMRQLESILQTETVKMEALTQEYKIKKKVFELLPDADNNIKMLEDMAQQSVDALLELAREWEKRRVPLIEEYRTLKMTLTTKKGEAKSKLDQIKDMRQTMKELAEELQKKSERYKQLIEVFEKLPKDINRAVYTRRILEIVKSVKKQKVDINKILIDTRALKKDINTISETGARSFLVTDELIFKDAVKDPTAKQAYKHLAAMNENFKNLISQVEEIGNLKNSSLELQSKIEQYEIHTNGLNVERIGNDLKEIKTENAGLLAKLKQSKEK